MILQRLYELARREGLTDDPAFKPAPVACLVNLGPAGEYLGLMDLRPREVIPSRKKDAPPKTRLGRGKIMSVPVRPIVAAGDGGQQWKTTDPASAGKDAQSTLWRMRPLTPPVPLSPARQSGREGATRSSRSSRGILRWLRRRRIPPDDLAALSPAPYRAGERE